MITPFLKDTALTFAVVALASAGLTGIVLGLLRRHAIMDVPNARSSHVVPTPRGGGWGLMPALLPPWIWATWRAGGLGDMSEILLIAGALLLMAVSWIDDRKGLGPAPRFAAQFVAVGLVMATLPTYLSLSGGVLPLPLDRLLATLVWLWFVNLFNFMDGIDGLAGGSAAAMGLGLMLVWTRRGPSELDAFRAAMIAAASLGFLVWNWRPARIFMGDVGSVPLGYLLGYALVWLAMDRGQIPALIIALYYLSDATITLLRRLARGERVWQAHREHFYQLSTRSGRSHSVTAAAAILVQLVLAGMASHPLIPNAWMLVPAALLVAALLWWMARGQAPGPAPGRAAA